MFDAGLSSRRTMRGLLHLSQMSGCMGGLSVTW